MDIGRNINLDVGDMLVFLVVYMFIDVDDTVTMLVYTCVDVVDTIVDIVDIGYHCNKANPLMLGNY
jgi:hypothetical protein